MLYQRVAALHGAASRPSPISQLREATAAAHLSVEHVFADFMAAPGPYLTPFLAAQLTALTALRAHCARPAIEEDGEILDDLIQDLSNDLRGKVIPVLPVGRALDPEAVSYLTLGSRLGTEVIRRHLVHTGIRVPSAFGAGPPSLAWQAFRARINALEGEPAALDTVIQDACRGFSLFRAAAYLHGFDRPERTS
ncbi:hypothetical protein FIU97_12795 [Roseivivax sp. THAF40]|uniref:hypothetical protein n=2 Tax=unclassified Roseivivax TaxID=2639302 RepID=UPI0012687449|nr:hypothetical protein [Roseivivax sp. THAF197b]QFS83644.1 hypothetical protein FIV09_12475 [Roseivivax sp. THAF197b]QFT47452.1 hypothetical protein FIU97_12795 [Roseivivax sp. THAF40]